MTYEVELKFPLGNRSTTEAALLELGAVEQAVQPQHDLYFNHPARDFAQTDEALRIRRINEENRVTYKGPVVDKQTKTRKEIEVQFNSGAESTDQFSQILTELGFRFVFEVAKVRKIYALEWESRQLELALDHVEELGDFLEIETLASEEEKDVARDVILSLAKHLGFKDAERRSYLRLLLELKESSSESRG